MSPRENESVDSFIQFVKNEERSELSTMQIYTPSIISQVRKSSSINIIDVDLSSVDNRPILFEPHWYPRELTSEPTRPSDDESEDGVDSDMIVEYDSYESQEEILSESEEGDLNVSQNNDQMNQEQNHGADDDVQIVYENIILDGEQPAQDIIAGENGDIEIIEVLANNHVSFIES